MQHLPEWLDNVGNGQIARGNFVQHGRKEDEVLSGRQHDFNIRRPGQPLLQVQRCVSARKAAAENQNTPLRGGPLHP